MGASDKPERYAWKAQKMLSEFGYTVLPVHPRLTKIEGISVFPDISKVSGEIDTVTLYVNTSIGVTLTDSLLRMKPRRVIFNPGSECPQLADDLERAGIKAIEACTLVLLQTGQF